MRAAVVPPILGWTLRPGSIIGLLPAAWSVDASSPWEGNPSLKVGITAATSTTVLTVPAVSYPRVGRARSAVWKTADAAGNLANTKWRFGRADTGGLLSDMPVQGVGSTPVVVTRQFVVPAGVVLAVQCNAELSAGFAWLGSLSLSVSM